MNIVFVGASFVGKTTISKEVARRLGKNYISTDALCHNHTYHEGEQREFIDDLKDWMDNGLRLGDADCHIIDVGSNTILDYSDEDLDYFKKAIGEDAIIYHLRPFHDAQKSFDFLIREFKAADKTMRDGNVRFEMVAQSLCYDLTTKVYPKLATKTIYTAENLTRKRLFRSQERKDYLEQLGFISQTIVKELKPHVTNNTRKKEGREI